jgi:hypothetical protein
VLREYSDDVEQLQPVIFGIGITLGRFDFLISRVPALLTPIAGVGKICQMRIGEVGFRYPAEVFFS